MIRDRQRHRVADLAPDEALIIEDRLADPPVYTGFNLSNFWGESYDYANHTSSLNDFQAKPDADGVVRYVVAHRDPGVANWLDPGGHERGTLVARFLLAEDWEALLEQPLDEVRKELGLWPMPVYEPLAIEQFAA